MTLRHVTRLAILALAFCTAAPALAQEDEEGRFAIGLGGGMVETDTGAEPYLTANLRIRAGYRVAGEERSGSVFGFVEPEVGRWSRTVAGADETDTHVGVNIGGAMRLRAVEYFIGGGIGYHFIDREQGGNDLDADDGIGVNAQFGFDLLMSETVSLFGVGRFDLIENAPQSEQGKAYLGVRFHF